MEIFGKKVNIDLKNRRTQITILGAVVLVAVIALVIALVSCGSQGGKSYVDYESNKGSDGSAFDFDGNYAAPELTMDGLGNDSQWQSAEVIATLGHDNAVTVKAYRGEAALFFLFEVADDNLLTEGETNDDAVTRSDSIEFYLDTLANGGTKPQSDDYQINLGIHGKTRIMQGSGSGWGNWNGLIDYEVALNGTLNDGAEANDTGYSIEVMIPYSQINIEKDDTIAVSFGHVDKEGLGNQSGIDWGWYGWTYEGFFCEPQTPNNYILMDGNNQLSKRTDVGSGVGGEGVAITEEFGLKNDNFANSILTLSRGEEGLNLVFKGTRRLSGHIELYLDTKESADHRDNDATCWCFNLNDDGTISGNHYAGGEFVSDGLVYNLVFNGDDGYEANLYIPYSYLNITKTEIFGISLGQWSTTANDWDGWGHQGMFVVPETPVAYVRVSADCVFYRAANNEKPNNAGDEEPKDDTVDYTGYTEVGNFGNKSDLFADSILRLKRTSKGIIFDFTGTRKLSGQIELYINTKDCAATREQDATCWRLDLTEAGIIGGTHFAGGALKTKGLEYELIRNSEGGYHATLFIPYSYLGIKKTEVFGISLGQWSTTASDWDGWAFEGQFVAPETPAAYILVDGKGKVSRGTMPDQPAGTPSDKPVDYTGYTVVGTFGSKNDGFANSTLRLIKKENGILFDLTGTRKLSGQIELYINTKDCAANRDVDATCWRIDLIDSGRIGGTHFAGGAFVTDGLEYHLERNTEDGYHATLLVPYTYLDITETEVIGISLGQWSTAANDWDGWSFEEQFVAPETPASYILIGAEGNVYRGIMPQVPSDKPDEYAGYTTVGTFGTKSEKFAHSLLRLIRKEDGILFDFVGTQKLSGHVELYINTKDCAASRDIDTSCWRLDLTDANNIGGTHYAGGAFATEGLEYQLISNDEDGYHATLFVPYTYLDITETEVIGISLGQWSTAANDWDGWSFEEQFVAPETPDSYILIGAEGNVYRGTMPQVPSDKPDEYAGYTTVGTFGTKSEKFAHSLLRLIRKEDGILFDFVGTQKLSGHVELYIDTKDCAASRDIDTSCWRLDLTDANNIGGTHYAGGAFATEGLEYQLISNDEDGYHATLLVPYTYLDITETEVFGISLGQWSTAANDWDGWAYDNQFVAPETPAGYIRVGADGQLYRANSNTAN